MVSTIFAGDAEVPSPSVPKIEWRTVNVAVPCAELPAVQSPPALNVSATSPAADAEDTGVEDAPSGAVTVTVSPAL